MRILGKNAIQTTRVKPCSHFFVLECGEMVCKRCGLIHEDTVQKIDKYPTPDEAFTDSKNNDYSLKFNQT